MNIVEEISRLPNFVYIFYGYDLKEHYVILGDHPNLSLDKTEKRLNWTRIERIFTEMDEIYSKGELSIEDKKHLAELMSKMTAECFARFPKTFTLEQQEEYISHLTEEEIKQIEEQVQMYKNCREYYKMYIY